MPTTNNGCHHKEDRESSKDSTDEIYLLAEGGQKKHSRRKQKKVNTPNKMQMSVVEAQVHRSPPAKVHSTARRNRSQSRHERHKCHKHRQRLEEEYLQTELVKLRSENHLLNKRLNVSMTSIDSGLPGTEPLPPFEVDIKNAYQHVKNENNQMLEEVKFCRVEYDKMKEITQRHLQENAYLRQDIVMLKNLVYRLNVELEKFQDLREKAKSMENGSKKMNYELPKYYQKNFLKPLLPLLRAYTEVTEEKNEIIEQLETNFEKFSASFNELLKENEALYKELEVKIVNGDESVYDEVKSMKKELEAVIQEKALYSRQARLEAEKLKEVHAVYKSKVNILEKEKELLTDKVQEAKAELYTLRGKHSVLKQELDRLRSEDESKVPLAVHSATIGECKRLFQDLKSEHGAEKLSISHQLKECETKLRMKHDELRRNEEERLTLEQGNFDLAFENDSLKRRIVELESRNNEGAGDQKAQVQTEVQDAKRQLRDAKKKNSELETKLQKTKKQLQQAMAFAEDIVREQEGLLSQLHEKQRENSLMASQFGSLKKKLKNVEKGAQEGLNSVEDKIRAQEVEKQELLNEVQRLTEMLRESQKIDTGGSTS